MVRANTSLDEIWKFAKSIHLGKISIINIFWKHGCWFSSVKWHIQKIITLVKRPNSKQITKNRKLQFRQKHGTDVESPLTFTLHGQIKFTHLKKLPQALILEFGEKYNMRNTFDINPCERIYKADMIPSRDRRTDKMKLIYPNPLPHFNCAERGVIALCLWGNSGE